MSERLFLKTEISYNSPLNHLQIPEETKAHITSSLIHTPTSKPQNSLSLFSSISRLESGKNNLQNRNFLMNFPDLSNKWDEILNTITKGKKPKGTITDSNYYKNIPTIYPKLISFFDELINRAKKEFEYELSENINFPDDLIFACILGIKHSLFLFKSELEINGNIVGFRTFNEFLFAIKKFDQNVEFPKAHFNILKDCISEFFEIIIKKLQIEPNNLLSDTIENKTRRKGIAFIIYNSLQTLLAFSIIKEPKVFTETKYNFLTKIFRDLFLLIQKSKIAEIIFFEQYDFEHEWIEETFGKIVVASFHQKKLSLFISNDSVDSIHSIKFNLKYVIFAYNYRILKMIARNKNLTISFDKFKQNIFLSSPILQKLHKEPLVNYIENKSSLKLQQSDILLLINENSIILRTRILGFSILTSKIEPLILSNEFIITKELSLSALILDLKYGLKAPKSASAAISKMGSLSINMPSDLLALTFKALLPQFLKQKTPASPQNYEHKINGYIGILLPEIVLLANTIPDILILWTFKLYLVQFINKWSSEDLEPIKLKCIEEISQIINETYNIGVNNHSTIFNEKDSFSSIGLDDLKEKCFLPALSTYVKLSLSNCALHFEETLKHLVEYSHSENKLFKVLYVLVCLLARTLIPLKDFIDCLKSDHRYPNEVTGNIARSKQSVLQFLKSNGLQTLLMICKTNCEQEENSSNFLQLLVSVPEIADYLLRHPRLDHEFYYSMLKLERGREFVLNLFYILSNHIHHSLHSNEPAEGLVLIIIDCISHLENSNIPLDSEKYLIHEFSNILISVMSDKAVFFFLN